MTYKDIVVHLGRDKRSPVRLDAAVALAERHQGRVTGVYVLPDLLYQEYASFRIPPNILRELDVRQRNSAAEVERAFRERIAPTSVQAEWRLMTGDPVDAVTTFARFSDITIVGQTHDEDDNNVGALADGVVLAAGVTCPRRLVQSDRKGDQTGEAANGRRVGDSIGYTRSPCPPAAWAQPTYRIAHGPSHTGIDFPHWTETIRLN